MGNPVDWKAVEELFHRALEVDDATRGRLIAAAAPDVREEVLRLLRHSGAEENIHRAIQNAAVLALQPAATVGPYRLVREIGAGGMGSVFLAERVDAEVAKQVAVKLIRRGLDTDELLERFRQERQILANLEHPYIARFLDAGAAPDGRPYLVMEYIDGSPLDVWCREKNLNVEARCRLFLKVCEAVSFAHRNLIVHRDLKPGNILVAADGSPRLLDFGMAKLLGGDSHSGVTRTMMPRALTPDYSSPEHFLGEPIATTADVYSLGAVLFAILAGTPPHRFSSNSPTELERVICRVDVPRPSDAALRDKHQIRGDLDAIVAKATRKEPGSRYSSIDLLADDITRYLDGRPVLARQGSGVYRFRKFVRRNAVPISVTALLAGTLIAGASLATVQARRADSERAKAQLAREQALEAQSRAQTERDRALAAEQQADLERNTAVSERVRADSEAATAKAVVAFLRNDVLGQATPNGRNPADLTVRQALDLAAKNIEGRFAGKPLVEADIRSTIASSYLALGLYPSADLHYKRVWELRRDALGENHKDTLDSLTSLAVVYRLEQKLDEAERLYNRILAVQRATLGENNQATLLTMGNLAVVYSRQGKFSQASALGERVLVKQRKLLGPESLDTLRTMNNLAVDANKLGNFALAEKLYLEILDIRRRVQGPDHPNTIFTVNNLAALYAESVRDPVKAERLYRQALADQRRILGPDHPDALMTLSNLGILLRSQPERMSEAETVLQECRERRLRVFGLRNVDTLDTHVALAMVKLNLGRPAEAEATLRGVCDIWAELRPNDWIRFHCEAVRGEALAGVKRADEAEISLLSGYRGMLARQSAIPASNRKSLDRIAGWIRQFYADTGRPIPSDLPILTK